MSDDPSLQMTGLHYVWGIIVSALSGWGIFSGKRLVSELDKKADKEIVNVRIAALTDNLNYVRGRVDDIHEILHKHTAEK